MKVLAVPLFLLLLALTAPGYSLERSSLPDTLTYEHVLTRTDEPQTWSPDTMFEHVNGEAELLIRYGAVGLTFVAYENEMGEYVSVDILDLGEPINAYGLYRLYSGCDGVEQNIDGATVLADEYTSYAFFGQYFLRINLDTDDNAKYGNTIIADFLNHFSAHLPPQDSLPAILELIRKEARQECEVNYHPEHIDYDLETGPGYTWVGKKDRSFSFILLGSAENAQLHYDKLKEKGVSPIAILNNGVIWEKAGESESTAYLEEILRALVEN